MPLDVPVVTPQNSALVVATNLAAAGGHSLVVHGTTGRTVLFTPEELVMPERFKECSFAVKQWDALRPIFMRRVMSEGRLQRMQVEGIVDEMATLVDRRLEKRRAEKRARNKTRRRQDDRVATVEHVPLDSGVTAFGVRLTNVASVSEFGAEREELVQDIQSELARFGGIVGLRSHVFMLSAEPDATAAGDDTAAATAATAPDADRCAIDVFYTDVVAAKEAVAQINGRMFGGRAIKCARLTVHGHEKAEEATAAEV